MKDQETGVPIANPGVCIMLRIRVTALTQCICHQPFWEEWRGEDWAASVDDILNDQETDVPIAHVGVRIMLRIRLTPLRVYLSSALMVPVGRLLA